MQVHVFKFPKFSKLPQYQQIIIALLILFGTAAGTTLVPNSIQHTGSPVDDLKNFDPFAYKAKDEVQPMMLALVSNPTKYNVDAANRKLIYRYEDWCHRENGKNKKVFELYLASCEAIINSYKQGESQKHITLEINEMNRLYNALQLTKK